MKKILLIEDEKFLVKVYRLKFAKEGFEPIVVERGDAALAVAKRELPDIIVLDMMLPGTNGFDVLTALKADRQTKDIPVIILSALEMDSDIKTGLEYGAQEYLTKSTHTFQDILASIRKHVGSKG